jgi:ABC-type transport system involved in cytochrome bd biosynthesis fused ATPase/permease subunit
LPNYCPKGFVCSFDTKEIRVCPKNFYCPPGTVEKNEDGLYGPLTCASGLLASCPPGTGQVSKFGLAGIFILLSAIIYSLFYYKEKADIEHARKRKQELQEQEHAKSFSDKPSLGRLSKTFDIEFEDLGLVLPNGVEIMGKVTGYLKSGRCTAIMGPSG